MLASRAKLARTEHVSVVNYFAWLFEHKERASGDIKTECDVLNNEDNEEGWDNLCMPRELIDIEISIPGTDDGEFKLVKKEEEEYETLREKRKGNYEDVKATAMSAGAGHKEQHQNMEASLQEFGAATDMMADKERVKKKRVIMRDLKSFSSKREGKNLDEFIFEMAENVKRESKSKKKFKAAYQKLLEVMEANANKENIETNKCKMNCAVFYNEDDDDEDGDV